MEPFVAAPVVVALRRGMAFDVHARRGGPMGSYTHLSIVNVASALALVPLNLNSFFFFN